MRSSIQELFQNAKPLLLACAVTIGVAAVSMHSAQAQLIPGTGSRVKGIGDDFEDEEWKYSHNGQKSSDEQDGQVRLPGGQSSNGRFVESALRGHPDLIKRVATPEGGLEGSTGALLLRTLNSGVPGRFSRKTEQDDLLMRGRKVSVSYYPSYVVRIWLPPLDKWENRDGAHFGFRTDVIGWRNKRKQGFLGGSMTKETTTSWPGIFISFQNGRGDSGDKAYFMVRGSSRGDFRGPEITETGWWTLGMSYTPDGQCHYYAGPGVDDLTEDDRIASHFPYNFRVQQVNLMFFDLFNHHDGRSWSTPFVVDDPALYVDMRNARRSSQPTRRSR